MEMFKNVHGRNCLKKSENNVERKDLDGERGMLYGGAGPRRRRRSVVINQDASGIEAERIAFLIIWVWNENTNGGLVLMLR